MPELDFKFKSDKREPKSWAQPPWRGRRFRGIELDQQRIEARAARDRSRRKQGPADPHRDPSALLLETWAPVEDRLRQAVDGPTFRMHLDRMHPHRLQAGTWVLACHPFALGWIRDRFGGVIASCAERPVEFVVCEAMA